MKLLSLVLLAAALLTGQLASANAPLCKGLTNVLRNANTAVPPDYHIVNGVLVRK